MEVKIVNLYQHHGMPQPEDGCGQLTCYIQNTDTVISQKRWRPAVLVLPGGGYGHVSSRESEPVALRFLARGYQAFVLRYAVAPAKFPTPLQEAALAMRYIRSHAEEMDVDANMVAAVGFSAGGHLCGLLGTLFDAPEVSHIGDAALLRPNALGLSYPVAVSWGDTHVGSFDNLCGQDAQLRQRLSLDRLVRKDMPPSFVWHTQDDEAVPVRNSLLLTQAMAEMGVPYILNIYPHGIHGLSTADAQVFPAYRIPQVDPVLRNWPEEMMEFFADQGLQIHDREANA